MLREKHILLSLILLEYTYASSVAANIDEPRISWVVFKFQQLRSLWHKIWFPRLSPQLWVKYQDRLDALDFAGSLPRRTALKAKQIGVRASNSVVFICGFDDYYFVIGFHFWCFCEFAIRGYLRITSLILI